MKIPSLSATIMGVLWLDFLVITIMTIHDQWYQFRTPNVQTGVEWMFLTGAAIGLILFTRGNLIIGTVLAIIGASIPPTLPTFANNMLMLLITDAILYLMASRELLETLRHAKKK